MEHTWCCRYGKVTSTSLFLISHFGYQCVSGSIHNLCGDSFTIMKQSLKLQKESLSENFKPQRSASINFPGFAQLVPRQLHSRDSLMSKRSESHLDEYIHNSFSGQEKENQTSI